MSPDSSVSPSASSSTDFFPSSFVLAPQSSPALVDNIPVAQSIEHISRRDPKVILSVSSFRSSKGFSSSPSFHSPLSTPTRSEDTNILSRGMQRRVEAIPGGAISSSLSLSKSSTVDGQVPNIIDPDGVEYVVDTDELVQSTRESFQQIEIWYSSGHPTVIAVEKEVRVVAKNYLEAIAMSVKMAGHAITFAADAVNLCQCLSRPSTDISLFIDEMRNIARLAHSDAKDTHERLSAIRQTLLQIINRIPHQAAQIKDEPNPILFRHVQKDLQFVCFTGWGRTSNHKRGQYPKIQQDSVAAVEFLYRTANDVGKFDNCVGKAANWWRKAETMISTLGDQVVSTDGRRLSTIRIDMVRKSWEILQKDYEVYKRSIGTLLDFYPIDKMRTSVPWYKRVLLR